MEISATSFCNLLLNISKAVAAKDSSINYANLLREIFEERDKYEDTVFADPEIQPQVGLQNSEILFGRYSEVELLLSKLLDTHEKGIQLSAISIIGDRGIGKTSLARKVYDDELVKKHFEVRVWVTIEGGEFKLQQAAHAILKSTMGMPCSLDDIDELDEMVRDTLKSQKCLIVFDGIDSMTRDSWLHMDKCWFDFVDLGSKVLITTPSKDIVDLVGNKGNNSFELKQLSRDDGWFLCRHLEIYSSNTSRLMAENLESLCRGVPLLLKLVGSLIRYDHRIRNLLASVDSLDDLVLPTSVASVAIFLCVWALPSQLRQCFAYCAIFPKGYVLNKEKIIHLWIAHGLVKASPGNNSLEDIGNFYFVQLLCRSFFTDITRDQYGGIVEFRIPSLIHDIGEHVARMVYNEKIGLIGSVGEDAGQLSVFSFGGKYESEDLQILMLAPTLYLADSLDHSLLDFHRLQSLDLSCSGIQKLSDDICALRELSYLNLSYSLLESLPDSIMDLSQLKILDLSWCYHLKVVPKGICKLILMRHLDFSWCDMLSCLPSGIGFLRSLTSLPLFVLGKDDESARLGELGQLNQLRGRLEIRNLESVGEITEAANAKLYLKNLEHLGLSWSKNADDCFKVLEHLQPNPSLKVLNITGYMGYKFPWWISSINSLINISITDCACKKLPSLGQLPFLKELQLNRMVNLECIDQGFYGDGVSDVFFPSLEQLELCDLPSLLEWPGARVSRLSDLVRLCCSGASALNASSIPVFRSLKSLTVEGCPKLPSLPSLPTLPNLILKNSSNTILYSLASFTSLSSLLISDMVVQGLSFGSLGRWELLKKLVICNIRERSIIKISLIALEHLGIIHCHELTHLVLCFSPSLQKLHIVDCPNLSEILVEEDEITKLIELVVEDCPQANVIIPFHKFHYLRKLILENCGDDFSMGNAGEFEKLEKLEYLSISGCLKLVSEFQAFPWLISHIPCIIVGNHKANLMDSKDLGELLISASNELKSEVRVPPRYGFSHGPQKSITEPSIQIKYKEIKKATKNFGPDAILGKGIHTTVYKGWIHQHNLTAAKPGSGIAVAVKKWKPTGYQGHEWLNVVKYLSQLHHRNLVKHIGYCTEKEDMILVCEFMPNGSLASHLYTERPPNEPPLDWWRRKRIALGSARGLSYLHEHYGKKIIHRDVKAANIYLNEVFEAAIGGFAFAKLMDYEDTDVTTAVRGTIGHIAPEYLSTGKVSEKTDVFGYGVTLLELITGKRVFDLARLANDEDVMLLDWVKGLLEKKKLERLVDPYLQKSCVYEEVYQLIQVALICTQTSPYSRPKMSEVVRLLEGASLAEKLDEWQKVVPHTVDSVENLHAVEVYQVEDDTDMVVDLYQVEDDTDMVYKRRMGKKNGT